jgi:hypothetical protein
MASVRESADTSLTAPERLEPEIPDTVGDPAV